MNNAISKSFPDAFKEYWNKPPFISVLKDVRLAYLEATGQNMLTNRPYLVICLLMAQAMDRMLDGYSGSSYSSDRLLHEAIGIGSYVGIYQIFKHNSNIDTLGSDRNRRYDTLLEMVSNLQRDDPEFSEMVNDFLAWDMENPVKKEQ